MFLSSYFVNIPSNIMSESGTAAVGWLSDLSPIWTWIVGILLFFAIIGIIISALKH